MSTFLDNLKWLQANFDSSIKGIEHLTNGIFYCKLASSFALQQLPEESFRDPVKTCHDAILNFQLLQKYLVQFGLKLIIQPKVLITQNFKEHSKLIQSLRKFIEIKEAEKNNRMSGVHYDQLTGLNVDKTHEVNNLLQENQDIEAQLNLIKNILQTRNYNQSELISKLRLITQVCEKKESQQSHENTQIVSPTDEGEEDLLSRGVDLNYMYQQLSSDTKQELLNIPRNQNQNSQIQEEIVIEQTPQETVLNSIIDFNQKTDMLQDSLVFFDNYSLEEQVQNKESVDRRSIPSGNTFENSINQNPSNLEGANKGNNIIQFKHSDNQIYRPFSSKKQESINSILPILLFPPNEQSCGPKNALSISPENECQRQSSLLQNCISGNSILEFQCEQSDATCQQTFAFQKPMAIQENFAVYPDVPIKASKRFSKQSSNLTFMNDANEYSEPASKVLHEVKDWFERQHQSQWCLNQEVKNETPNFSYSKRIQEFQDSSCKPPQVQDFLQLSTRESSSKFENLKPQRIKWSFNASQMQVEEQ